MLVLCSWLTTRKTGGFLDMRVELGRGRQMAGARNSNLGERVHEGGRCTSFGQW
jgi:hypothetical protein